MFGVRAGRPFFVHILFIIIIIIGSLRWPTSIGRYSRVYRLWASTSSGAYLRVLQVAGAM